VEVLEDRTVPSHLIIVGGGGAGSGDASTGFSATILVGANESKAVGGGGMELDLTDIVPVGSIQSGMISAGIDTSFGVAVTGHDEVQATFQIVPDSGEQIGDPVGVSFAPVNVSNGYGFFGYSVSGVALGPDLIANAHIGDSFSVDVQAAMNNDASIAGGSVSINLVPATTVPVITSLNSTSAPESSSLTVNGTNFTTSSVVQFNGVNAQTTTFISDTQLTATIPEEGSYNVTVADPASGTSNGAGFTSTDAAPVLTLPANQVFEATSAAGAAVNFAPASATDYDESVTLTYSSSEGSQFPLGTTTVTDTATNTDGTTANGSFTVTVRDTTPPVLTLPPPQTVEATGAAGATDSGAFTATATDAVTASPTIRYFVGGLGATPIDSGYTFALGTTTVTVQATDAAGNSSNGIFTVTVQDTPTVSVSDAGGTYNGQPFPATATVTGAAGQAFTTLEGVGLTLDYVRLNADSTTTDLGSTAPAAAGNYQVTASFAGSADYLPASNATSFNIGKSSPILTTAAGPTVVFGSGVPLTDSAILSGTPGLTGTITFVLHDPSGTIVDTETAPVNGPGTYSTPIGYLATQAGTYQWSARYGGDANNNPASGALATTPTSTLTGVSDIYGVAIDAAGNRYVAESGPSLVAVFAPGSTTPASYLTGVQNPTYLAFDHAGDLFVFSSFTSQLWEFAPGSTTPTATLSGVKNPQGNPAFDASGDLFISNFDSNTVTEYAPGSTAPTATLTGLDGPGYLAFDAGGDLFVTNVNANTVSEFAPGALTPTVTLGGLNHPQDLACDSRGNLFVCNYGSDTISEFSPGATTPTATLTGLSGPGDVAFDASGNLFVLNHSSGTVSEFAPESTTPTVTLTGLSTITVRMAFDAQGDLYVVDYGNSLVREFTPVTDPEVVTQATPTVTVSDAGGTYNSGAFPASATVNGGSTLEGVGLTLDYVRLITDGTTSDLGSTAPTAAGSYEITASFAGSTDYSAGTALATFIISQATPTVTVGDAGGTYNGGAFPVTAATVTGVGTDGVIAQLGDASLSYTYYQNGAPLDGASVNTGSYAVVAHFAGSANYTVADSAEVGAPGSPGDPLGSVGIAPGIYGSRSKASFVTEVGRSLADVTAIDVLDLHYFDGPGGTLVEPAPAGSPYSYLLHNMNDGVGDDITLGVVEGTAFTIAQAIPTVVVNPVNATYDGSPHGTTGEALGVAGVDLGPVAISYSTLDGSAPVHAGTYTAIETFSGNQDYTSATGIATITIGQAPLTVTVPGLTKNYGQTINLANALGVTVPTGVNGETLNIAYASAGAAASADVQPGGYPITAQLSDGTGKLSDYSVEVIPGTLTVQPALTNTTLTASASAAVFGQAVTFTAAIQVSAGAGVATGTVSFMEGSKTLDTATLDSTGSAAFITTVLATGNHTITAVYGGSLNYQESNSAAAALSISPDSTTTAVASSVNPSALGQSVTLTATVNATSPGSGTPTGTLTFKDGGAPLGTAILNNGTATLTTSALALGTNTISAAYAGDGNFNGSTSTSLTQTVNRATTTALKTSGSSSVFGQSVTFTATVSGVGQGSGTPSGTVTFLDGSTTLGTATLATGVATFKTSNLAVGPHAITAVYGGSTGYNGSTSPTLTQKVNQDASTATLRSSANPSVFGQTVTLTATVKAGSPGAGTPTGTVTFKDVTTNTVLGTVTLSNGTATWTTSALSVGQHSITVSYGGDGNFTSVTSATLTQTVNKAKTKITLSSSANPSLFGQTVTFTATVGSVSPGAGTPGAGMPPETVTIMDGTAVLGTAPLTNGIATFSIANLAKGKHTITAIYNGDLDFLGSTSAGLAETIS
jgi:hypothetical protein